MAKNIMFIINPVSGHSPSMNALEQLVKVVKSTPSYHLIETEYRGHATELAKKAIGIYQVIVAIGGDGTINEVVSGIENSNIDLAIIPQGSGNGLAFHLGVPTNWVETISLIEGAEPKPIDLISVNNRLVVNVGGIGFDGHVAKLINNSATRGWFGYMKFILQELYHFKEFEYTLNSSTSTQTGKAFIIAIANGSEFGNRFKVAANAQHNDGKFNLVIIKKPPFLKLMRLLLMQTT
jgi:YegS/Rv2252/BmrU family lipid kinase